MYEPGGRIVDGCAHCDNGIYFHTGDSTWYHTVTNTVVCRDRRNLATPYDGHPAPVAGGYIHTDPVTYIAWATCTTCTGADVRFLATDGTRADRVHSAHLALNRHRHQDHPEPVPHPLWPRISDLPVLELVDYPNHDRVALATPGLVIARCTGPDLVRLAADHGVSARTAHLIRPAHGHEGTVLLISNRYAHALYAVTDHGTPYPRRRPIRLL